MPNFRLWKSQQLQRLKNTSDEMFERLCSDFGLPSVCRPLMEQDMTMKDTPEAVIVEATLPGVSVDDLEVVVSGLFLKVRCRHEEACAIGTGKSLYESRFRLPCKVRTEDVRAEFADHKLIITMPKCKRPETKTVKIETR